MIETERLILTPWRESDRAAFRAMTADPEVMHDYLAPWTTAQSDERFERLSNAFSRDGHGKWALRVKGQETFLGYCGISPIWPNLPCAPGLEIGWRMTRAAWGHGYATEAARAALNDIFARTSAKEVLTYTLPTNERSLAVMRRLGLAREAARDFHYENGRPAVVHVAYRLAWG
jgi:RimJ/RimL family protein N-acetyltransferase